MHDYKDIHIGRHIRKLVELKGVSNSRACMFLKCSVNEIERMYLQKSIDSEMLLKWSKLLEYNLFMFYHSHLQIYSPKASVAKLKVRKKVMNTHYTFKKNLYSPEIIDWILSKIHDKELSVMDVVNKYSIPKTTVYRWKKKIRKKL